MNVYDDVDGGTDHHDHGDTDDNHDHADDNRERNLVVDPNERLGLAGISLDEGVHSEGNEPRLLLISYSDHATIQLGHV